MKKYTSKIYSIKVPDHFVIEEQGDQVIMYDHDNGVGAINISSYVIPHTYDFKIEAELIDFVSSNEEYNLSTGLVYKEVEENRYAKCIFITAKKREWKYWLVYENNRAILITYNSNCNDANKESSIVKEIVSSVRIL